MSIESLAEDGARTEWVIVRAQRHSAASQCPDARNVHLC